MAQDPWGRPAGWPPAPPVQLRFNPADALISNDYAGWWTRGFALLRAGWRPMAMVHLVLAAPILALLIPSEIAYERHERAVQASLTSPDQFPPVGDMLQSGLILMAGAVPAALIFVFGVLATVRIVTLVATGGTPRPGEAMRTAARRIPAMLGWHAVASVMCLVAFFLCFLPLIYVGAVFTILPVVVQLERGNAVARCFRLFHADPTVAIGRAATLAGLGLATSVPTMIITSVAGPAMSSAAAGTLSAVLQALEYAVSGLVLTPLIVTLYADLRARHEPFGTAYLADARAGA